VLANVNLPTASFNVFAHVFHDCNISIFAVLSFKPLAYTTKANM